MSGNLILADSGKILVEKVRDTSINYIQDLLNGRLKGEIAEHLRKKLGELTDKQLDALNEVSIYFVDQVIHNLLWICEQDEPLQLAYISQDGEIEILSRISDGLSGEVFGENGWNKSFSRY